MATLFVSPGLPGPPRNDPLSDNFFSDLLLLEDYQAMTAEETVSGESVYYGPQYLDLELPSNDNTLSSLEPFTADSSSHLAGSVADVSMFSRFNADEAIGVHFFNDQSGGNNTIIMDGVPAPGSSLSPGSDPIILTPPSTLGYAASTSAQADDDGNELDDNISPTTTTSKSDGDYVWVRLSSSDALRAAGRLAEPRPVSNHRRRSSCSPSPDHSDTAVHVATQTSLISPFNTMSNYSSAAGWGSMTSAATAQDRESLAMNADNNSDLFDGIPTQEWMHNPTATIGVREESQLLTDNDTSDRTRFHTVVPQSAYHVPSRAPLNPYTLGSPLSQGHGPAYSHQPQQHYIHPHDLVRNPRQSQPAVGFGRGRDSSTLDGRTGTAMHPSRQIPGIPLYNEPLQHSPWSLYNVQQQNQETAFRMFGEPPSVKMEPPISYISAPHPPRALPSRHTPSPPRFGMHVSQPSQPNPPAQRHQQPQHNIPIASSSTRPLPALAQAPPQHPVRGPARLPKSSEARRGGRKKDSHLPASARNKIKKMRQEVACWRCALQRDPCDDGYPCNRCKTRFDTDKLMYFDTCERSKLWELVHDFLPVSMTLMHQKQTIEDTVKDQVLIWDEKRPIDVYLSSGYGPPLICKLFEFRPRTNDLLGQFQYLQNPGTGLMERKHKYAPPLGLLTLGGPEERTLMAYLETLLEDVHLPQLGWTCYEEETQVDPVLPFQASLLDHMCTLYMDSQDANLRKMLHQILRMTIITYIMGHTLTIADNNINDVISHIRYTPPGEPQKHTSPRLANRQLKFYFGSLRMAILKKALKDQHDVFRSSGPKSDTWLTSFCAMLAFAMVLEEIQRTLMIQADAKAAKQEMEEGAAEQEAKNACERIDGRFDLMIRLFRCKYRDRKWDVEGTFGPKTPEITGEPEKKFVMSVRALMAAKLGHLQARASVQFHTQNTCLYTSRLTAKFLLGFLEA